tara:strand:- start:398 stop:1108 length:711 start_codon:yes stop_codon:yes gene_type:complete
MEQENNKMRYTNDENSDEILLSDTNQQVMMEWEKPYMEACIDALKPEGDVLEIGFGCAYSADKIQSYNPKSHTIIECSSIVLKKLEEWSKDKPNVKIVKGKWQDVIHTLGIFDEIFMDDFPLDTTKDTNILEIVRDNQLRFQIFVDLVMQNHTRIGSKISGYLNDNNQYKLSADSRNYATVDVKYMDIVIPDNCKYRTDKKQKCQIPLITKTKRFNLYKNISDNYIRKWTILKLLE